MSENEANRSKAERVFNQAFAELNLTWVGPEFDFDRVSYKARIQHGYLKGRVFYISSQRLEDANVSAIDIKNELLAQIRKLEAGQK